MCRLSANNCALAQLAVVFAWRRDKTKNLNPNPFEDFLQLNALSICTLIGKGRELHPVNLGKLCRSQMYNN